MLILIVGDSCTVVVELPLGSNLVHEVSSDLVGIDITICCSILFWTTFNMSELNLAA